MAHGRRTRQFSARLNATVLERLRRQSRRLGQSDSRLAERLIDEGLRMEELPGIVFRSGPTGRRAGLLNGPDVWEIIGDLKRAAAAGLDAVETVLRNTDLREDQVRRAAAYYDAFPEEIEERIRLDEELAERAQRALKAGLGS